MDTETEVTTIAAEGLFGSADEALSQQPRPSAEWVRAVSDLLDTDPNDLLAEMGYYDRADDE